jgi:hypothetical protein
VLNYSWVGDLHTPPKPLKLELSIPWNFTKKIIKVTQSEPQWQKAKSVNFSTAGNKLLIPIEIGINALVIIDIA